MKNKLFFLILLVAGLSFAFADDMSDFRGVPETEASSEVENVYYLVELDSVDIYKELIAQEDKESSYRANIEGIVVGGGLVCVGTFFLVSAIYEVNKTSEDPWDEAFGRVASGVAMGISFRFTFWGFLCLFTILINTKFTKNMLSNVMNTKRLWIVIK